MILVYWAHMWQTSFEIYGQKLCIKVELLSWIIKTELGFLSWIY